MHSILTEKVVTDVDIFKIRIMENYRIFFFPFSCNLNIVFYKKNSFNSDFIHT